MPRHHNLKTSRNFHPKTFDEILTEMNLLCENLLLNLQIMKRLQPEIFERFLTESAEIVKDNELLKQSQSNSEKTIAMALLLNIEEQEKEKVSV